MITRVAVQNFKGGTWEQKFGAVTLIGGDNATGKTSRLEALRLGLLGYMPGPKPVKQGFALHGIYGSGRTMSVEVDMGGKTVARSWMVTGDAVKSAGEKGEVVPASGLDPSEFAAMTGPQKVRHLLGVYGAVSVSGLVNALVAEVKAIKLDDHNAETEQEVRECAAWIESSAAKSTSASGIELLSELAELCRQRVNLLDAEAKRMSETVAGLSSVSSDDDGFDHESYESLQRSITEQQVLCARLASEVESWKRDYLTLNSQIKPSSVSNEAAAQVRIAELKNRIGEAIDPTPLIQKQTSITSEIASIRAALSLLEIRQKDICQLNFQLRTKQGEKAMLDDASTCKSIVANPRPDDGAPAVIEAASRVAIAKQALEICVKNITASASSLENARHSDTCPTCGQKDPHQSTRIRDAEAIYNLEKTRFCRAQTESENAIANQNSAIQSQAAKRQLAAQWDEASNQLKKHADIDARIAELTGKISEVERDIKSATPRSELEAKLSALTEESKQVAASIDAAIAAQRASNEIAREISTLEKGLEILAANEAIRSKQSEVVANGKQAKERLEAATRSIDTLKASLDKLTEAKNRHARNQAEQASRARVRIEARAATVRAQVARAAQRLIGSASDALLDKAVGPMLEVLNRICSGLLPARLVWIDGEIKLECGHGVGALSDSERTILDAAMCVALASKHPLKLVAIPRLEAFDRQRRMQLAEAAVEWINAGIVSQVVLVGVIESTEQGQIEQRLTEMGANIVSEYLTKA